MSCYVKSTCLHRLLRQPESHSVPFMKSFPLKKITSQIAEKMFPYQQIKHANIFLFRLIMICWTPAQGWLVLFQEGEFVVAPLCSPKVTKMRCAEEDLKEASRPWNKDPSIEDLLEDLQVLLMFSPKAKYQGSFISRQELAFCLFSILTRNPAPASRLL